MIEETSRAIVNNEMNPFEKWHGCKRLRSCRFFDGTGTTDSKTEGRGKFLVRSRLRRIIMKMKGCPVSHRISVQKVTIYIPRMKEEMHGGKIVYKKIWHNPVRDSRHPCGDGAAETESRLAD